MTAVTARILEDFASAARALPSTAHAQGARRAAIEALEAKGLPSSREENWRYANLRSLERVRFLPAPRTQVTPPASALPAPLPGVARYVFIDGWFAAAHSAPLVTDGPTVRLLSQAADAGGAAERALAPGPVGATSAAMDQRFALLNQAFVTDGIGIEAEGTGREPREPSLLEVLFVASAEGATAASYPRLEVLLSPGAQLTLIERHLSAGDQASFVTSAVQVQVARGARLEHYRLQELSNRSILFDTLAAQLAEDAAYRLHWIGTGAQSARTTLAVRLNGERAEVAVSAAALGDRQQVQDAYAVVEHAAPNARTVQTFRGIAAGRARVAFNGKIIVAAGAHGTDSRQSLRGLLAGPEAEIDVRPQLEIYNDDVRCSHGATAGKLDENMLFYLLSRGLARESAQRLLKWAFLEDVIAHIAPRELRRQIEERLAGQLRDDALRELL